MNRLLFYHSLWVFLWPILFSPISSDAQDKLRVGLSSVSATSGSIWVAEEKGLFKKHGIDAEVIIIGGGASRVVSSLIAGEIQFSVGGGDSVIRSSLRGADTVVMASPLKTGLQRLMVRPEIKTPAELKGKKVAITRFGSASHWVLQLFLRKWGMRMEDIQTVQLGSSPAMFASLEKGAVDGAVFTIPTFFVAEDRGYRSPRRPRRSGYLLSAEFRRFDEKPFSAKSTTRPSAS